MNQREPVEVTAVSSPEGTPGKQSTAGLALSGGGFRATLFHVGGLGRLNELVTGLDLGIAYPTMQDLCATSRVRSVRDRGLIFERNA